MIDRSPTRRRIPSAQVAVALRKAITRFNRRVRQTRPVGELTVAQVSALQMLDVRGRDDAA